MLGTFECKLLDACATQQSCASRCWACLLLSRLHVSLPSLQLAWRPGRPTRSGLCCAVVAAAGGVLIGYIGMQLQPFDAAPAGVRAVAWAPEGQQMAFAAGGGVTVLDWASRASFSAAVPVSHRLHCQNPPLLSESCPELHAQAKISRISAAHAVLLLGWSAAGRV